MRLRSLATAGTSLLLLAGSLAAAHAAGSSAAPALPTTRLDAKALASRADKKHAPAFKVGFAKELLDPNPADVEAGTVHLGGYGLFPTRPTDGPLIAPDGTPEHLYVRAMAVENAQGDVLMLAGLENQGTFAAYKQCACGIWDMRQQVVADLNKAHPGLNMAEQDIVVNADHSHSGPDLIGLWGGVPIRYLKLVHDQTVKALEEAFEHRLPANLFAGDSRPVMPTPEVGGYISGSATPGEDLVHSQFDKDSVTGHDDHAVDTELRVLEAVTPDGDVLGTLVNYAAHATITGSGNRGYSADWPGWVARKTEEAIRSASAGDAGLERKAVDPIAVTMVADVGRSQPPRPNTDSRCGTVGHPSCDSDGLDTYSRIMLPFVTDAMAKAQPVRGSTVKSSEVFTREAGTNAALLGVSYSGYLPANGYGAYRAGTPPWLTGHVIGTFVSSHRIGDQLLTAAPGEAYPDIRFGVERSVSGSAHTFTFGLANDQLGYLIAPTSEYPWATASKPGNDNSLFNVSATYGDHVTCSQTSTAVAVGFTATGETMPYGPDANPPACAGYTASDMAPMGPSPQGPWPFGDPPTPASPATP